MFASGKTATVSGGTPDDKFNYVTMLLHGNGTNGAQNNTFLDSSTNNYTITRVGNTTQGSFSPYVSNWSINNGTANGNGFQFSGTTLASDFTMEAWVFATPHPSTQSILFSYSSGNVQMIYFYPDGRFGWYRSSGSGVTSTGVFTYNTWNHVAAVRSSGVIKLYLNGVDVGISISDSSSVTVDSLLGYGGSGATTYNVLGFVSNARITNTVVYSSNFTPSTTQLTAISGTQLLTFQSNRFIDNSTNAFALTVAGSPSVQRFNPFGTSTAYSTSVIGGSGYFDGSGDYLTATNSGFNQGSDFTFECWVYPSQIASTKFLLANARTNYAKLGIEGSTGYPYVDVSGVGVLMTSNTAVTVNQWNHVAMVRSGSSAYLMLNGVRVASASKSTWVSPTGTLYLCAGDGAAENFQGYVSDMRFLYGTALYTGTTYTIPTAPLTAITNTSFLCNYTNGAIFDNAMMNDLETVGTAQISTSVKKYGTGSLAFDGSSSGGISAANNVWANFGNADFTIEAWVNFNNTSSYCVVASRLSGASGDGDWIYVYNYTVQKWRFAGGPAASIVIDMSNTWTPTTGTWYHVAVCRSGNNFYFFIDGIQQGTTQTSSATFQYSALNTVIGNTNDYITPTNGYIDDLRITKGYARYTSNFTAPTAVFSDKGPI
jgi:hypothetical protein